MISDYRKISSFLIAFGVLLLLSRCGFNLNHIELVEPQTRPADLHAKPDSAWTLKVSSPPKNLVLLNAETVLLFSHRGELSTLNIRKGQKNHGIWRPLRKSIDLLYYDPQIPRLYVSSPLKSDILTCDLQHSKIAQKYNIRSVRGKMVIFGDTAYVVQNRNQLTAFRLSDGKIVKKRSLASPVIHGLYAGDSDLWALCEDGKLHYFQKDLKAAATYPLCLNPQPVMRRSGDIISAGDSRGRVVLYDLAQDLMLFEKNFSTPIYTAPYYDGEKLLVAFADGSVSRISSRTGEILWRFSEEGLINQPLIVSGNTLVIPYPKGNIIALDIDSGAELWRIKFKRSIRSVWLVPDGILVASGRNKIHYFRVGS